MKAYKNPRFFIIISLTSLDQVQFYTQGGGAMRHIVGKDSLLNSGLNPWITLIHRLPG